MLREQSATVIQAAFRGHQARGGVRELKEKSGENFPSHNDQSVEETSLDHTEDLEPENARTLQEDITPLQTPPSNIKEALSTEDISGGHPLSDEGLEDHDGKPQELQDEIEQEVDDVDNSFMKEEVPDGQQTLGEEVKRDNLAIKEDLESEDFNQANNEDEPKDDDKQRDMDGQNMTQTIDHTEEKQDDPDNLVKEDDGEDHNIQVQGEENIVMESQIHNTVSEAEGEPVLSDKPDDNAIQEVQSHDDKTNEEQQETENKDTANEEQLEDKVGEPIDNTTTLTEERQEDMEDPKEENEAFRKQPEEALDIDLDDPDVNAAAAKIQAGFRGHMTRKKMKSGDKDVKHKDGKEGSSAQGEHEGD
ncbi:hypothetical protein GDO81_013920 [Engystomops pustulosus]|uniref:Neuromodulin n=2 Tax=Engystomops pustulosus TaxID=76066 RepID=A0AAV7B714_ENGPU|nr:hypothetical protein GDO81_013920 [Engystomops pustulosus]